MRRTGIMRGRLLGLALVPVVCLAPLPLAVALADGGSYQSAELVLEQPEPASPTSVRIAIDYVSPADPSAKPPAVAEVIERLPKGSRIDTSAVERCTASDAALATMGQAACPAGSRVGGGEVDLDTGPAGTLNFNVTQFNNEDELILLLEQKGGGIRTTSRAKIDADDPNGPTITATVPPIPGGPPDGFTAIKRVRLTLDAITTGQGAGAKNYITTPPSCPSAGSWTTVIEFSYRDGTQQAVQSSSPCNGRSGGAHDRTPPHIAIRGLPRGCAARGFSLRTRVRDASPVRRARVRLDGRLVRSTRRKRFNVWVPARRLPAGRHTLTVIVRDEAGNRARTSGRFQRCR